MRFPVNDNQIIFIVLDALLLLFLLYRGEIYFSARKLHRVSQATRRYFVSSVFPQNEFAPHLQKVSHVGAPVSSDGGAFPTKWLQADEVELNSTYYLRTCRRISDAEWERPSGGWYGLPVWIQDLVAAKGDPRQLCSPFRQ